LATHLGGDLCAVAGLNIVERSTNGAAGESSSRRPDDGPGAGVATGAANQRAYTRASQAASQRALIGIVRRATANARG
jgi:hypothetical protein